MKKEILPNNDNYKLLLFEQKETFQKEMQIQRKRGVLESQIKELHNRELVKMQNSIYEIIHNGEFEYNKDPFMASFLVYVVKLIWTFA